MQIKKRKRKDLENESTPPIPFHHLNQINVGLSFFLLPDGTIGNGRNFANTRSCGKGNVFKTRH